MTVEQQQAAAAARKQMKASGMKWKEMLGIEEVLVEDEMGIRETNGEYMDDEEPIEEEEEGLNEVLGGMAGGIGMFEEWEIEDEEGERDEAGENEEGDVDMADA